MVLSKSRVDDIMTLCTVTFVRIDGRNILRRCGSGGHPGHKESSVYLEWIMGIARHDDVYMSSRSDELLALYKAPSLIPRFCSPRAFGEINHSFFLFRVKLW